MADGTLADPIIITGTTPDPKSITLPDIDYAYVLTLKELTQAIRELIMVMRR